MKLSMTVNNRTLNNMFGMQMTENSLAWFLRSDRKFLFGSLKFLKILVAKILDFEDFWIRPSSYDLQILASVDLLTIS